MVRSLILISEFWQYEEIKIYPLKSVSGHEGSYEFMSLYSHFHVFVHLKSHIFYLFILFVKQFQFSIRPKELLLISATSTWDLWRRCMRRTNVPHWSISNKSQPVRASDWFPTIRWSNENSFYALIYRGQVPGLQHFNWNLNYYKTTAEGVLWEF